MGLPISWVSVRASVSCMATTRSPKRAIASMRLATGTLAQAGCAARAALYFRRTAALPSASTSARTAPLAGLTIFMTASDSLSKSGGRALGCMLQEIIENRRVVDERSIVGCVEFGVPLHREHVARTSPPDCLDHTVRLGPGFDDEIAPEVLHGLMMDGVGLDQRDAGIELREAALGHDRCRVTVPL